MTIRQDIKDQLSEGPLSLKELADLTGHDIDSIRNACGYMNSEGSIKRCEGQKIGMPNPRYELPLIKAARPMQSRLTTPAWVPPKALHRPEIHAPGIVVRRLLTGEVLQ